jgi:hypothetical protein
MENLVNRTVGKVDSEISKMAGNFEKTVADFNASFESATKNISSDLTRTEARVEKMVEDERLQCRLREAKDTNEKQVMKLETVELKSLLEQQSKNYEILSLKFANEKRVMEYQMERKVQELEEKFDKKLEEVVNQKFKDFERKIAA